jgi:hypothetical protein
VPSLHPKVFFQKNFSLRAFAGFPEISKVTQRSFIGIDVLLKTLRLLRLNGCFDRRVTLSFSQYSFLMIYATMNYKVL